MGFDVYNYAIGIPELYAIGIPELFAKQFG